MIFRREVGEKGQVVIPIDIRKMLKIKNGEQIIFEVKGNEVNIKPEQSPEEFIKDFFNVPKLEKKLTMKEIKKTIMEEYDERISGF